MLSETPSSCRALAARLGRGRTTVWRWRTRLARALAAGAEAAGRAVAAATAVLRESRKASREWVRHAREPARYRRPDRLRWHDYPRLRLRPPDGPRYRVPVRIAADRGGGVRAELAPPAQARALPPEAAPPAPELAERLARFIRPFRGPATRHLAGYLAWFGAREQAPAAGGASGRPPLAA
jgi:hypothetical protein